MSAEGRRSFVDTNVLAYAHDAASPRKRAVAAELVARLWREGGGCLSIQVLQEFFVTVTRNGAPAPAAVEALVSDYARWTLHEPHARDVLAAIELHRRAQISFWDAMIVRSASVLRCEVLYTEDLNAGQELDGVLVVNPFAS